MIKQETDINSGAVRKEFGLADGAEVIHLDGQVHRAGHDKVTAHEVEL